jgi:hypothetical protein|nr:MAG TPA: hypothetical protein [Caudoviricetes sp.]
MRFSSIDILIGDTIYKYTSENKMDWSYHLDKIEPEKILYLNDYNLVLNDIDLDDDNLKVDEYDNFIRVGEFILMTKQDMFGMKQAIVGLDPHNIELHKDYFIALIFKIMNMVSKNNIQLAIDTLRDFYRDYVNGELNIEYYREFNLQSKFKVSSMNYIYYIDSDLVDVRSLDISYNEKVLRYISSLIWGVYGKV